MNFSRVKQVPGFVALKTSQWLTLLRSAAAANSTPGKCQILIKVCSYTLTLQTLNSEGKKLLYFDHTWQNVHTPFMYSTAHQRVTCQQNKLLIDHTGIIPPVSTQKCMQAWHASLQHAVCTVRRFVFSPPCMKTLLAVFLCRIVTSKPEAQSAPSNSRLFQIESVNKKIPSTEH